MTESAPPPIEISGSPPESGEGQPLYFAVGIEKLVALSICSGGIYELYWFYKNWKLVEARYETKISPFWRAFFAVFWCYPLFKNVAEVAKSREVKIDWQPGLLALGWIVVTLAWQLPDPLWLVSNLAVFFLIPFQKTVATLNASVAPSHAQNRGLSGWNVLLIVVGGLSWVLLGLDLVYPEQPNWHQSTPLGAE